MLKTRIVGPNEYHALVSEDGFLYVETKDHYEWEQRMIFFTNPTYGDDLTINAAISGSNPPEFVHNGNDDTYWTGSIIESFFFDFDFSSTDQNNTEGGSQSIDFTDSEDEDIAQFARPAGDLDLTDYVSFSGYVYITSWPQTGTKQINFYGWDTNTGTQVGSQVNIGDYVSTTTLNTWQRFIIPLSDMNLVGDTINALRFQMIDVGAGAAPEGYLDDLQFDANQDTEGPQAYTLDALAGKIVEVTSVSYSLVVPHVSTLADATLPNLSYDQIGDLILTNGILYRRIQDGETKSSWLIRDMKDFIRRPNSVITNLFGDGTYTTINVRWDFIEGHVLKYGPRDRLQINISDNFDDSPHFQIIGSCRIRDE